VYFNTAYLLAQQWWGRQLTPNHTVGSKILSEGLARYSALCLRERKYGRAGLLGIRQTLGWDYGWGRRTAFSGEHDLLHANAPYLWNAKAGMVLYGLGKSIGADSLNAALRTISQQWANRNGGPYAGSPDLYRVLQHYTPDSLHYYLSDSWLRVAMYDNRITAASITPLGRDSGYRVTVTADVHKQYTDKGRDTTMNDYIDISIWNKTQELTKQTYRWTAGLHTVELVVHQRPTAVEIDPDRKLMDANEENNRKEF
jgi:ABC-2 type transport system permease protein